MHNQSMEFIAKNVNVCKPELDHFRGACSWGAIEAWWSRGHLQLWKSLCLWLPESGGHWGEKITVYLPHFSQSYPRSLLLEEYRWTSYLMHYGCFYNLICSPALWCSSITMYWQSR